LLGLNVNQGIKLMLVVDAQVYIWQNNLPTTPHHRQITDFSTADLLKEMDEAGIDAAVIHPPIWDPGADDLALEAARLHPNRLSVLGQLPLDQPESRSKIAGWKDQPGMLGLRFGFTRPHMLLWPTDGTMDWLWPEVDRAGIPVALNAGRWISWVGQISDRHPGVKLMIDHMGRLARTTDAQAFDSLPEMLALARYPNVAIKATAAPNYSSAGYPFATIHDYLHRIYDAFGPERMFWGTDITGLRCSWKECVTLFTEELPWLSESDKVLIMGKALCDWLEWDI